MLENKQNTISKNDQQKTSLNDFKILQQLGEGSYAKVYKVQRLSDNKLYAMKKVKIGQINQKDKINALNEIRIMASIQNKNIVEYKEAFIEREELNVVMEFCEKGDLQKLLKERETKKQHLEEAEIWRIICDLTCGLKSLHQMGILHRDIKSANIFIDSEDTYKLGDLNISKITQNGLAYTQTGTPYYSSPEVWQNKSYDNKCDIWGLGCLAYELCTFKPPFLAKNMELLQKKIATGKFYRIPPIYSNQLQNFIQTCLYVTPSKRPDCQQIINHEIVKNFIKEKNKFNFLVNQNQIEQKLLKTIKLPRNLTELNQKFPKHNYRPDQSNSFSKVDLSYSTEDSYLREEDDDINFDNLINNVESQFYSKKINKNPLSHLEKKENLNNISVVGQQKQIGPDSVSKRQRTVSCQNSIQEAQNNIEQESITLKELDKLIEQVLQNSEILNETLQEYRFIANKSSTLDKSLQNLSQQELFQKNLDIYINAYQYRSIINCINDQISDISHPLYAIKNIFYDYFIPIYQEIEPTPVTIEKVIDEVKQFANFFLEILRVYYDLDQIVSQNNQNYKQAAQTQQNNNKKNSFSNGNSSNNDQNEKFLNLENISNFVYGIIFQNSKFYKETFKFFENLDIQLQKGFKKNLLNLINKKPDDFGISDQFCLNQLTLDNIITKSKINQEQEENKEQQQEQEHQQLMLKDQFRIPYKKAIENLKQINQCKSPIQKLKIIIDTSDILNECIKEFYAYYEASDKEKFYDGDHLLSLFIYLISQSQIHQIYANCKLIERFVLRNTNNSVSGYLLITIEGCVHHIASDYNKIK